MTPEQRVAIVLELQARIYPDADQQGFARVLSSYSTPTELSTSSSEDSLWVGTSTRAPGYDDAIFGR
jgi:hypothetical protein